MHRTVWPLGLSISPSALCDGTELDYLVGFPDSRGFQIGISCRFQGIGLGGLQTAEVTTFYHTVVASFSAIHQPVLQPRL